MSSPSNTPDAKKLLTLMEKYDIVDIEDVLNKIEDMKNKEIIEQHPYAITLYSNGRWKTYLPDSSKPDGRRQIAKSTKEKVYQAIIDDYKKRMEQNDLSQMTFENLFEKWMIWRRDNKTDSKTIKENKNDWNRFLSKHSLRKMKVKNIEESDMESFFLDITQDHAITYKCLTNVKSLLNGIFKHGIRLKIITVSPLMNMDYKQFQTRCKPTNANKENYSDEERKKILDFLYCKTDIYALAVELAFYLCLRIGELLSIKKENVHDNSIFVKYSIRKNQTMNDDLTFNGVEYTVEERIKGNKREGFRQIPLTPNAQAVVNKILELYPDGEYLLMRYGKPLYADSFNRYLKEKVCQPLSIPYRSSHQIRFTVATKLHEGGVPLNQLSTMLGHADTRTTFHYIRQQKVSSETNGLMVKLLD